MLSFGLCLAFFSACAPTDRGSKKEGAEANASEERNGVKGLLSFGIDTSHKVPEGLEVGEKAPSFRAMTESGDTVTLEGFLSKGPLVLFFYRGQWCPVCNRTLGTYADSLGMVKDQGASVLAVTPETDENVRTTREKSGSSLRIVPDSSQRIMKAYEVRFRVTEAYSDKIAKKLGTDIAENNGSRHAFLPVPATYLIGKEGKVLWRHFDPDYHDRATVLSILRAMGRARP
jgi:peroxiredoxin